LIGWAVTVIPNGEIALNYVIGYNEGFLEQVVKTSTTTKARLLHYYPPPALESGSVEDEEDLDGWCSTHIDHGCLTGFPKKITLHVTWTSVANDHLGLTSAMYVDEGSQSLDISRNGVDLPELIEAPDPDAGLYIKDRKGGVVKVEIPKNCLAFQTGEGASLQYS
jgi:hypothetical protein